MFFVQAHETYAFIIQVLQHAHAWFAGWRLALIVSFGKSSCVLDLAHTLGLAMQVLLASGSALLVLALPYDRPATSAPGRITAAMGRQSGRTPDQARASCSSTSTWHGTQV